MAKKAPKNCHTVSAKLPAELVDELDRIAEYRSTTRSFLMRELVEAAVGGRVIFRPPSRGDMTLAELGASDVGAAARKLAQDRAAAACDRGATAREVDAATLDVEAVARRAARLISEGR